MENVIFGTTDINKETTTMLPGYQITCSVCGEKFFISRDNAAWYLKKGLEIPKKCPICRAKLKNNRAV